MTEKAKCAHGRWLTRAEAAEHMACTAYGRPVGPRTPDRWADEGRITRQKVGGLQWVRFDRDELNALVDARPLSAKRTRLLADRPANQEAPGEG